MNNLYPEPLDIIANNKDLYVQYKRALHDISYFSNDTAYRKIKPEALEIAVKVERKLLSYGYTVDFIESGNIIHWRVCAWREGELLRPWLLDRENPADREYIENWRNYAAPELRNSRFDWPSPPREDDTQRYGYRDEITKQTRGIGQ